MNIAILGSGAVGGYIGARLAQAGEHLVFLDVGRHLEAMRQCGLTIKSPLGDFTVRAAVESDPSRVSEPIDLVLVAVKTYDNQSALPPLTAIVRETTVVLTLQNGVDSVSEVAQAVGEGCVLGGAAYLATAQIEPGVIQQTGSYHRVVFGEVFGSWSRVTPRVERIAHSLTKAGLTVETVADARIPLWEKFIYLAPTAAFAAAAQLPFGALWSSPGFRELYVSALNEVEQVARAEGVPLQTDVHARILSYVKSIPPTMRPSLLIDRSQGKRLEVEALIGSVIRHGRRAGVSTPIAQTLYAVLKPHECGVHPQLVQISV